MKSILLVALLIIPPVHAITNPKSEVFGIELVSDSGNTKINVIELIPLVDQPLPNLITSNILIEEGSDVGSIDWSEVEIIDPDHITIDDPNPPTSSIAIRLNGSDPNATQVPEIASTLVLLSAGIISLAFFLKRE